MVSRPILQPAICRWRQRINHEGYSNAHDIPSFTRQIWGSEPAINSLLWTYSRLVYRFWSPPVHTAPLVGIYHQTFALLLRSVGPFLLNYGSVCGGKRNSPSETLCAAFFFCRSQEKGGVHVEHGTASRLAISCSSVPSLDERQRLRFARSYSMNLYAQASPRGVEARPMVNLVHRCSCYEIEEHTCIKGQCEFASPQGTSVTLLRALHTHLRTRHDTRPTYLPLQKQQLSD